jgi:hypothetical protein
VGAKALVLLKDKTDDTKDLLVWKWIKGAATTKAEFGDPVNSDTYELCIYDASGLRSTATAPADGLCNASNPGPCWKESTTNFKYKDKDLDPDGVFRILLKSGIDEKAKIILKGKGVNLDMPDLTTLVSPVTVQLKGNGLCWGAQYSFPPALYNTAEQFKDKAD